MKTMVLFALALAGCVSEVDSGGVNEQPPVETEPAPDPCNRQGSGWEDAPGCLCPFECPERGNDARICDQGVCRYRVNVAAVCNHWCDYSALCTGVDSGCESGCEKSFGYAKLGCEEEYAAWFNCVADIGLETRMCNDGKSCNWTLDKYEACSGN